MAGNHPKYNVRSKVRWGLAGVFVLFIVASSFDAPVYYNRVIDKINSAAHLGLPRVPEKQFNLGLDLQGGAYLVYQADVRNINFQDRGEAVEGVRDVIERRVNAFGVSEPIVQTTKVGNDYRIIVELPGITDIKEAIQMIGETPILEFKEQNDEPPRALTTEEKKQLEADNKANEEKAKESLKEIKSGKSFEEVAKAYSEDEPGRNNGGYLGYINRKNNPSLFGALEKMKKDEVSRSPVQMEDGFNVLKRGQEKDGETEVSAKHILICYLGAENCNNPKFDKNQAKTATEELYKKANAANFTDLAKENSTDPGSKDKGGDLGWFSKGMMVPEFEEAVFQTKVGQIVGPVETAFGYHIIYKTGEQTLKELEAWRILVRTKKESDFLPPQEPWKTSGLSGKQLEKSEVISNPQTGAVEVSLQFNSDGKELFREITTRNVNKPVAIFLDGLPISIPTVREPITDGRAVISGAFSIQEAKILSQRLNAGALPVPVELISQQSVGATLGAESLSKSLYAGIVGTIIVMLFMVFYYRLPGFLAAVVLVLYATLTLAVTKLIGATLTLSGIAGYIMSLGMAVDANVLIFERLKEELRAGKSLKVAFEEGFLRAWPSIRDSNISTLITCIMLLWFGSSFVQGFAVTLTIGILVSMFTAITVTRTIIRFIAPWFKESGCRLFLGYKKQI